MKELELKYYFEDMKTCPIPKAFEDIEYPWEALEKKDQLADFSQDIKGKIHKSVVIMGNAVIGEGTVVSPYVVIEGPVIIGRNCTIRPFALIRPGTIIGDNVVIGNATEIKNTIIFNEAKIASHVFVGDSIIGKGARIGSGTIVGNRRFDQKDAKVKIQGKLFNIGRDKYGGIFGDQSRLGANCATSPGVMVGKFTWVYGGCMLAGLIEKEKLVKLRQKIEIVDKERQILSRTDKKGNI